MTGVQMIANSTRVLFVFEFNLARFFSAWRVKLWFLRMVFPLLTARKIVPEHWVPRIADSHLMPPCVSSVLVLRQGTAATT